MKRHGGPSIHSVGSELSQHRRIGLKSAESLRGIQPGWEGDGPRRATRSAVQSTLESRFAGVGIVDLHHELVSTAPDILGTC